MPEIYKALSFPEILLEKKYDYAKEQLSYFFELSNIKKGAFLEIRFYRKLPFLKRKKILDFIGRSSS